MIAVMMIAAAMAQEPSIDSVLDGYGDEVFLQSIDYLAATVLQPAGRAAWPGGAQVEWLSAAGELTLNISNSGGSVIEIDWNRSAFVDNLGQSDRLAPGSTRRGSIGQTLPPSIIPPGGTLSEALVRVGAVSLDGVAPLLTAPQAGETATVTISANGRFVTQRFVVAHNPDLLDGLALARRLEVKQRAGQAEAERLRLEAAQEEKRRQDALSQARAEVLKEAEGFNANEARFIAEATRYQQLHDSAAALADTREHQLGRWGALAAVGGGVLVLGLAGDSAPGVLGVGGGAAGGGLLGVIVSGAQASQARRQAEGFQAQADAEREKAAAEKAKGDAIRAKAAAIREPGSPAPQRDGE
jgi:hypothetical protein